jgi:hypothetical protein
MSNEIVLENQKPGNPPSEWGLSGGSSGPTTIEGYAAEQSIDQGGAVHFKINTDSTDYRIDIYRLGYYNGDGARKVATIDHHSDGPQLQPEALFDSTTGLVDAGNWNVSATWDVPSDAVSGVYLAKLTRTDGTFGESQIAFVVRNDNSKSDILVQTDDTTWQAYNSWGGRSLYDGLGTVAVSYNRPISEFTPASAGGTPATNLGLLFSYSYPEIRWLEQNGYDVTYASGIDTARDPNVPLGHHVFLSTGHDEYWSGSQRANVEAARDAGVNLAFWGGNDVYWRTRWGASMDGSQDYRTLITYKTSQSGRADPSGEWTGLWRDLGAQSAYGITPENALTGTFYMVFTGSAENDTNSSAAANNTLVVGSESAKYRFWSNTSVANLTPGESVALGDYLGYEWDVDPLNSYRPNGLIHLSSTTAPITPLPPPSNTTYYSGYQYTPPDPEGYATHNLTLYRDDSGALVFSAGTMSWGWALDSTHAGTAMNASSDIQQAMVNLLADMGAFPVSLKSGLVAGTPSADHDGPLLGIHGLSLLSNGSSTTVTLTGTAADHEGAIAGVQISTDGGITWRLANGTDSWDYTYTTTSFNYDAIRVAAIDDSANIGFTSTISQNYLAWLTESEVGTTDLGWNNVDYTRLMADLNGDGKRDYVAFGDAAVYVNFGGTSNGLPIVDFTRGSILPDFSKEQGFSSSSRRGIEHVMNYDQNGAGYEGAIIWAQTANGISYYVPTAAGADSVNYEASARTINSFGTTDGWTNKQAFDFAVVSKGSDQSSSIIGFGQNGIELLARPFENGGAATSYLVSGSTAFGTAAGWDASRDVLAVRDVQDHEIDLNGDGVLDVVGIGTQGVTYALGQQQGQTGMGTYSLGPTFTQPSFTAAERWDASTKRYIADVNGDGHVDLVGFGNSGVWLSMGQETNADGSGAFKDAYFASAEFGNNQGWDPALVHFEFADVNGDKNLDIVGFGKDLTAIALGGVDPITGQYGWSSVIYTPDYSATTSWDNTLHLRTLGDVNGDGTDEFIVSGDQMSYVLSYSGTTV